MVPSNINSPYQEDNDGSNAIENMKAFQHARNMTGVVGDSQWHSDIKINELWDKLSVAEPNGNYQFEFNLIETFKFICRCSFFAKIDCFSCDYHTRSYSFQL